MIAVGKQGLTVMPSTHQNGTIEKQNDKRYVNISISKGVVAKMRLLFCFSMVTAYRGAGLTQTGYTLSSLFHHFKGNESD